VVKGTQFAGGNAEECGCHGDDVLLDSYDGESRF